ncbi:glycosyltransferase [candidate division KSB1 bacterium]|nr:glycosyltransferase [candidate division KSB1 bacterium]
MRILYLSQYYPPEIGATQTRAFEMASNLVRLGHSVTMITEFPNHPLGEIPPHYRGKIYQRTTESGIDLLRMWVFARKKKNFVTRMLFYLSFMVMSFIGGCLLRRRYDIVYATSPPLFVAVSGYALARLKRSRFVMEVRDLWPESAIVLGELRNPRFIRWSEQLERFLYNHARCVVTVTRGIYQYLGERGYTAEKVKFIPNGANTDTYKPAEKDRALLTSLGIDPDKFIIIYTGLLGLIHGMEFVLYAARRLKADADIFFLFVGDGVLKEKMIQTAAELGLDNIKFLEAQPEKALPGFIQSSDAGLVTTRKIDLCKGTLPVKMFTYMACAKPILLCVEGEARELVEESRVGLNVEPENTDELIEAIKTLKSNSVLADEMGKRGRLFVERHFSRRALAKELETVLQRVQ